MNKSKLKQAEKAFLKKYPGGFNHPNLVGLGKKHKMEQMIELAQESFKKTRFKNTQIITEQMVKIVSRASMVSMFEKPKFRDMVAASSVGELSILSDGLRMFLHGNQKKGFEQQLEVLKRYKLAKWSLITIIPNYYYPHDEVFVKPTTAKSVIDYFELQNLTYKPQPSWEFYQHYRNIILEMRALVDPVIAPNNAAFGGFLMMNMGTY